MSFRDSAGRDTDGNGAPGGNGAHQVSDQFEVGALDAEGAARFLNISKRLLWSLSVKGVIPSIKLGRRRLYPRHLLVAWMEREAAKARRGRA